LVSLDYLHHLREVAACAYARENLDDIVGPSDEIDSESVYGLGRGLVQGLPEVRAELATAPSR